MKAFLTLSLALITVAACPAQVIRPGGVGRGGPGDGHGDRRDGHYDRRDVHGARPGYHPGAYIYRNRPSVYVGIGPSYYPSYYPSYGYYPGYGADYPYYGSVGYAGSGSAASNGLLLGALAGGIIGNNSGSLHNSGWRGAAWGAGLGWLLGSVADANRRPATTYGQAPAVVTAPPQAYAAPAQSAAPAAAPQQITIINNYYNSSPMSGANNLFGR